MPNDTSMDDFRSVQPKQRHTGVGLKASITRNRCLSGVGWLSSDDCGRPLFLYSFLFTGKDTDIMYDFNCIEGH